MPYRAGTVDSTVPAGTVRHGTARVRIGNIYFRAVPYRAGTVKNCQSERSIIHSFDWKSAVEHDGWCLKCLIVYLAGAIQAFVMYCFNGTSRSSLLIESTDSMICIYICDRICENVTNCTFNNIALAAIFCMHNFLLISSFFVVMNYDLCLAILESMGHQLHSVCH